MPHHALYTELITNRQEIALNDTKLFKTLFFHW